MKQVFKTNFLLLAALLGLTYCQSTQSTEETPDAVMISGTIENGSANKAVLLTTLGQEAVPIEGGSFSTTVGTQTPTIITMGVGRRPVTFFARPGDSIRISFDATDEEAPKIYGELTVENEFLSQLADSLNSEMGSPWAVYNQPEALAITRFDELETYGRQLLDEFLEEHPKVDREFKEMSNLYVQYFAGQYIANYPTYHGYANPENSDYEASPELASRIADLQQENPQLLGLPLYIDVLKAKKTVAVNKMLETDSTLQGMEGYTKANELALQSEFSNPGIVEMMTYAHLDETISFSGIDDIEAIYQDFVATAENEILKNKITSKYGSWEHLKAGQAAPDFNYPDIESVMHSLSDYRGKVVYIDVWATWCGPCLAEQPYLAEIEKAYEGNENIVFMGVSIDADKSAWEKMVKAKEMSGVQIFADGAWESDITRDYMIKGIPRFILVDADGKLVDATAYRPSNDKLKEQLESLVEGQPVTG